MYYHVKVIFKSKEIFEDDFEGVFINDNIEVLFLYSFIYVDEEGKKGLERYSIGLSEIESVEINPIYEDSR